MRQRTFSVATTLFLVFFIDKKHILCVVRLSDTDFHQIQILSVNTDCFHFFQKIKKKSFHFFQKIIEIRQIHFGRKIRKNYNYMN